LLARASMFSPRSIKRDSDFGPVTFMSSTLPERFQRVYLYQF
jgi:hypothetical protein